LITALGVCGHVAEGLVLSAVGISVIVATFLGDPTKASGLDGAVKALDATRFGTAILIAAAVGFTAYASIASRWRDTRVCSARIQTLDGA
jgi:hypothetical protein